MRDNAVIVLIIIISFQTLTWFGVRHHKEISQKKATTKALLCIPFLLRYCCENDFVC